MLLAAPSSLDNDPFASISSAGPQRKPRTQFASVLRGLPDATQTAHGRSSRGSPARRRREVLPRFHAGSEVKLESDHAAARRLEDDDCGAGVGLVGGVDAVPIRVTRPFGGASETWAPPAAPFRPPRSQIL